MLNVSYQTYYLGEIFNPRDKRLPPDLALHRYQYISSKNGYYFEEPLHKILAFQFSWPKQQGLRRYLPSLLLLFQYTKRWFGYPRPILKDPFAALSAEWLAKTYNMDVICLIRHPAAFVYSLKKANWIPGIKHFLSQPQLMQDWLYKFNDRLASPSTGFIERGALLWMIIYYVLTSYARRHPEWMLWRLEDISADPAVAFEKIYCKLGLHFTERIKRLVLEYSNDKNPEEFSNHDLHLIKRNSRAAQSRWRSELSPAEIATIRSITEPVSNLYYSDEDW